MRSSEMSWVVAVTAQIDRIGRFLGTINPAALALLGQAAYAHLGGSMR